MNILVKMPTRERKDKFFQTLAVYRKMASGKHAVQYVVSCDANDETMNTDEVRGKLAGMPDVGFRFGFHGSKVEACNADMDLADERWMVCVLASDDMVPEVVGWDEAIAEAMQEWFPETDGCLWFYDGHCKVLCTLSILGRLYYERFGYIYHPSYKSLWCDNEHTLVSQVHNKLWKTDRCIIRHKHHIHGHGPRDRLLSYNEAFSPVDKANFEKRKKLGFPP